MAAIVERLFTY